MASPRRPPTSACRFADPLTTGTAGRAGRIRGRAALLALAATSLVATSPLHAQVTEPEIEPGERVRVSAQGYGAPIDGRLIGFEQGMVRVRSSGRQIGVALDAVQAIERRVLHPDRDSYGKRGAWIGAGIAIGTGLVLSFVPSGEGANMAMAPALFVGVPLGVVLGRHIGREAADDWEAVDILAPSRPDP